MSLLLEALKKAEKAKEEAQRRADAGSEAERDELSLERANADAVVRKPVMTRDQLPEISAPLEIVSDDLKPAPAPEPAEPAPRRREPEAPATAPQSADRATARKVFEAKFREPNPRMPFYIAMGCLGTFAVGTVVYFYLQLRPPPPLVNTNPPRQSNEAPAPSVAQAQPAALPTASAASGVPGLPTAPAVVSAPPVVAAPAVAAPAPSTAARLAAAPRAPAPRAEAAAETPRLKPQPLRTRPAVAAESAPAAPAAPARAEPQVNPKVEAGYAAYQSGDPATARREYQQALAEDPVNRDALLGLAALDVRAGRYELAESAYLRLLQANPRDSSAHAALVALRAGRLDPLVAESRLKSLIASDSREPALNFALGNQFAQQGRWAEAQQQFFKAVSAEPDNADYVYNLAVSLDQLHQPRPARDNYQRAIALAEKRGASFDLSAARVRAAQLAK